MSRPVRIAAVALVLGVVIGVAAGVLLDVAPAGKPGPAPLRTAPPRPPRKFLAQMALVPGTVRVERRAADPDGDAEWVLRSFRARPVLQPGSRVRLSSKVLRCVQLGREVRGRFGWIDGTRTFRPVAGASGAPTQCDSAARPLRTLDVRTLATGIDGPSPRLVRTAIWGSAGEGVSSLLVRANGATQRPDLTADGAFLAFADPSVGGRAVTAVVTRGAGRPKPLVSLQEPMGIPGRPPPPVRPASGAPVVVDARAPDPDGGLPWGLGAVRATNGAWCSTLRGRIVGDRVGNVDFDLGTLTDPSVFAPNDCPQPDSLFRGRRTLSTGTETGGGGDPGNPARASGRNERRTLPGSTIFAGHARADVREITMATPRGVRTLLPSPRAHTYLAVFDGEFPTGDIVVTGLARDGTSFTERFSNGDL